MLGWAIRRSAAERGAAYEMGSFSEGGLLAGAEHEGGEDGQAGALGGFGGIPDLV
jgi:hypothetical protein